MQLPGFFAYTHVETSVRRCRQPETAKQPRTRCTRSQWRTAPNLNQHRKAGSHGGCGRAAVENGRGLAQRTRSSLRRHAAAELVSVQCCWTVACGCCRSLIFGEKSKNAIIELFLSQPSEEISERKNAPSPSLVRFSQLQCRGSKFLF